MRTTRRYVFGILRDGVETVQIVEKTAGGRLSAIPIESVVDVYGVCNSSPVKIQACTVSDVEIAVDDVKCISAASLQLPFCIKDACASDRQDAESGLPTVGMNIRLDNRAFDLRTELLQYVWRISTVLVQHMRSIFVRDGFVEIHTPKIIGTASEGGANVFEMKYFDRKAYLAQSPQLYKQMAILGDFRRVFEIGAVFRAENSNTKRHMTEFVGIDGEMEICERYEEVIFYVYALLRDAFARTEEDCSDMLRRCRAITRSAAPVVPAEPVVLTFREAVQLFVRWYEEEKQGETDLSVREEIVAAYNERKTSPTKDLATAEEGQIAAIVKSLYGTDLFVIKDYPTETRPFYTKVAASDRGTTHSYDFIFCGEEILSGSQRNSDVADLEAGIERCKIDRKTVSGYVDAFRYGAPPHGGFGMGYERIVKKFLGLSDVRCASMFPRDPGRLTP